MKDQKGDIIINVSVSTIIKTILVLIFFYVAYLLSDLILVILTSIVVASSVEPAAKWFIRHKIPRIPAVLLVYVLFVGLFAGMFYFFLPPLLDDFSQFFASLPQYLNFLDQWNPWPKVLDYKAILQNMVGAFSPGSGADVSNITHALADVFRSFFNFMLVLVLSFYFAVQEKGIENFLKIIVPDKNEKYVIDLWYRSQHKIGKWIQGQILLGVLVGALVYLGLLILGVKQAFLLAFITAVFELIPVFGPTLSAIPAVMIGFTASPTLGFMTIALYVLVQQFENHLIYPVVVRKVIGVPPIIVILGLIVGAQLGGFMGLILAVPLAAVLMELVNDVEKKKIENR
ncbi:MAG: AI-2E family transporter [Candidatus Paceibacterota bacterium]|jgi:predicted PurR-regulated permease PerM|nr:AI-2E family transporter [Candidatus Paceibacterota bacterium]